MVVFVSDGSEKGESATVHRRGKALRDVDGGPAQGTERHGPDRVSRGILAPVDERRRQRLRRAVLAGRGSKRGEVALKHLGRRHEGGGAYGRLTHGRALVAQEKEQPVLLESSADDSAEL